MTQFSLSARQFVDRHNGINEVDEKAMLETIGVDSLEQLISETVPASIRRKDAIKLPKTLTEAEMLHEMWKIANENKKFKNFIGYGYYDTHVPTVILRNILENPGWYTQYTPYQAEIAQGRLEALLNFQTMITDLTGLEIANASLLDEATAAAEAMGMLFSEKSKNQGNKFLVSHLVYPQTIDVLHTRAIPMGIEIEVVDIERAELNESIYGILLQYPDKNGEIRDYKSLVASANELGIATAVASDLLALTLITPPGEWGASVVVGTAQRFGVPMGYGGPHAAFFATKDQYKRQLPGRIIGVSIDAQGNRALRMALQTREQHIKREKATSNICTAQVLLAIMNSMYAVYHGPKGIQRIAARVNAYARLATSYSAKAGLELLNEVYFDTVAIAADDAIKSKVRDIAEAHEVNFNYFEDDKILISFDETTTVEDINLVFSIINEGFGVEMPAVTQNDVLEAMQIDFSSTFKRTSTYLEHPVFNTHHSETEMLRYIKYLESKDLSLCHSMIALGSCTMKLNATTEMIPVTWNEFGGIHPFAPLNQTNGYQKIFKDLVEWLSDITGFASVSLQPNSGAQGEYAGLMVIREYLLDKGEGHRNIALIPSSAHGTNPASAVMAGMKVVVVKCDDEGNIDFEDLKTKAEQHSQNLACLMVTYPSTHGVFEEAIKDICALIHEHGGQVYMDGANMNAQVGLTSPGLIGADVCHLNLHKTFCIPHGGGGPGMGPIGVAAHLVPFLPTHSLIKVGTDKSISAVSAAPYGSASILLISYIYIRMMGSDGLVKATEVAILNANYMKALLEPYFKILYTGKNGRAAHEMIVDMRSFKQTVGVEVEDIAKRLIDYGFHAPTVSFPVAGTIMIEPTESESKAELDRFCEALINIKKEIDEIELGIADKENNVLKNAPHTAAVVTGDEWSLPYSRQKAAYPANWTKTFKFWPTVARVNNTYGDRNLVCTCPPIESYEEA